MLDGEHYTQMSADGKKIIQYSFKTGKETGTIFDVNTARDCSIKSFDDYIMSPDEKLILIQTETKPIYRRSFTANYYIFNVKNNKMEPLSENGPQQVPLFSPDGNQIAFVRDNNIYLVKLLFGNSESQVTKDGKFNEVLNGIPDWVYEEEFGFNRAFDFSADSQMLAYIRFDESQVPMYSFPLYKGMVPALEKFSTYPGEYEYKYPMPGIDNSKVTVHTFDIKSKVTRKMDLPLDADGYIPRIKFTDDENALAIMTLNRHQNRFDLYFANPRSTLCKLMVRDEAPQYIKEEAYSNIVFYPKNFVVMSEKDGYNHLYLYTSGGNLVKQITKGNFEVKDFLGWDEATNTFYFESNEGSPLRTAIYKVDGKGKKTKLSKQEGTHKAIFSNNMKYYINTFLGNISERRVAQLIMGLRGLPEFLVANPGLNSGFMIPQYAAASMVSQNKMYCYSASSDSIVSSNGQEDHVSMGANAATKLFKIMDNLEHILAIELMNAAQGIDFRRPLRSSPYIEKFLSVYRKEVPFIREDIVMYKEIHKTVAFLKRHQVDY